MYKNEDAFVRGQKLKLGCAIILVSVSLLTWFCS